MSLVDHPAYSPIIDTVQHVDLLTLCDLLPDASVDCILADLPYGTTACSWDTIIPLDPMWRAFKRIIKPRGAIVLTASQPFTSVLVGSNLGMFRYEWVWNKVKPSTALHAEMMPLRSHENVLVFSKATPLYLPQMVRVLRRVEDKIVSTNGEAFSGKTVVRRHDNNGLQYPKSILTFSNADQTDKVHPTQKPVALFEYLIKTYTQPGDLVLDPTCGSGTTAVAARNTQRHFICGDTDAGYVAIANDRLRTSILQPRQVVKESDLSGLPLFAAG